MERDLLNLVLFELDMLAHNGIIFFNDHFLGHGAGIFLGHIVETCAGGAFQLNFNCGCLAMTYILKILSRFFA